MAGWTLNTTELTVTNKVYGRGVYTPTDISLLTDRVSGGKVVVGAWEGSVYTFR